MKIIVTGKNINVSDKIQEAIDKKFEKLGKYFADDTRANIVMHPEKDKVKLEATIVVKGTIFRAEEVAQDIFDCIDIVGDKLQKQMSKYKGKMQKRNKSNESVRFDLIPEYDDHDDGRVVNTKKFELTPMTPDEAAMQMELLGHTFYVFLNVENDSVSVVYKRADNDYGVLQTTY